MNFKHCCFARTRAFYQMLFATLIVLGMIGCGGGGNGTTNFGAAIAPPGSSGRAVTAQLILSVKVPIPTSVYSQVRSATESLLTPKGFQFSDLDTTVLVPNQPLSGVFVQVGKALAMTDSEGIVVLESLPVGETKASVLRMVGDAPLLSFDLKLLAPVGGTPPQIILNHISGPDAVTQNTPPVTLGRAVSSGNVSTTWNISAGNHTTRALGLSLGVGAQGDCQHRTPTHQPCCLDYDGACGNGTRFSSSQTLGKYTTFLGSTCMAWVNRGVCLNADYLPDDSGGCLNNHKGRICQEIVDTEFTAKPDKYAVAVKGTVKISLHNNTRKNETYMTLSEALGKLTSTNTLDSTDTSITVKHYTGTTGSFSWNPDQTVTYTAPDDLPNGETEHIVTVTVMNFGGPTTITIKVCKCL